MISNGRKPIAPARGAAGGSVVDGATDARSFEVWVSPHWPAMRRLAERIAGRDQRDDVLQEALTTAWRSRSKFDETRGTAQAWMLGITANHAKKAGRSARRHDLLQDADTAVTTTDGVDIERAISKLPARQRLAVELFYFVGLSVRDVASVMRCAEGTVKSTLAAARTSLRNVLGEEYR